MLVLDANILVRGALGRRVRQLLATYSGIVRFLLPDSALAEAREHLPAVLAGRGLDPAPAMAVLEELLVTMDVIDSDAYSDEETSARERMAGRDVDDWPVLAVALTFEAPIWTEDADFFGCGAPTWTTDRVEIYLRSMEQTRATEA